MSMLWIGPPPKLRDDVAHMYEKYADRISRGDIMMLSPPGGESKYYVYEWFTRDMGKVFYVGKGTGRRYRHIISDMKRPRGKEYQELQDSFGIEYRFLVEGVTSFEAELYELCVILERTDAGEVLLQSAHGPGDAWYGAAAGSMVPACVRRDFVPEIIVSKYRSRYFGVEPPEYDAVDRTRLAVTFRASLTDGSPATVQEMERVKELIVSLGGKAFSTVAKGTQAVVEFDCMDYEQYVKYKSMGLLVYHAFDVARELKE